MSDFAQILMAVDNVENKCSKYGQTDEEGAGVKNRSNLRRPVVMHPSMTQKPKHFEITDMRVDFAIRQLNAIKGFVGDLKEINGQLRLTPQLASVFQQIDSGKNGFAM